MSACQLQVHADKAKVQGTTLVTVGDCIRPR